METGIRIGAEVNEATARHVQGMIESVFRVGYETHMEQETIRAALETVGRIVGIGNASLSDVSIIGEKHVTVESDNQ